MVNMRTFVRENLLMTNGRPTVENKAEIVMLYFFLTDKRLHGLHKGPSGTQNDSANIKSLETENEAQKAVFGVSSGL